MNNLIARSLLALAASTALLPARGQTFTGLPTLSVWPMTQMGTVSASLLLTTAGGISSSGLVTVNVSSGPVNGTLLQFVVDRPFNLSANQTFTTNIDLDGYSLPPAGLAGNTGGAARTYVVDNSPAHNAIAGTSANLPLSLVAGMANWPLSNPSVSSAPFTLAPGAYALRQFFDLDGIYLAGIGGNWLVDFPLNSSLNPVPEPGAWSLFGAGLGALGWFGRRRCRIT